jgi:hypothetical protein
LEIPPDNGQCARANPISMNKYKEDEEESDLK